MREKSVQFPKAGNIRQKQPELYGARCVHFYDTLVLSPHISSDNPVIRLSSLVDAPPISAKRHNGFHQASSFHRVGNSCLLSVLLAYQLLAGVKGMNGLRRGEPSRLSLRVPTEEDWACLGKRSTALKSDRRF